MKKKIIFSILSVISIMIISACNSDNNENRVTDVPQITLTESVTETPAITKTETTDIPEYIEGDEGMPTGKWYDKNGNTVLEFVGNKMYVYWWTGMETPEEFDVAIEKTDYTTYIYNMNGEYGKSFDIMSRLEIKEDGTLSAYEEILDGESHSYKFVPEDRIEEERAVKDFSSDMPKTIESRAIKNFQLCLNHYYIEGLGEGTYSWEIRKNDEGKYESIFDGMGPSYIIIQYKQEVDDAFMEGVLKLLDDEKVAENNGLFYSHDKNNTEYDLYITFESHERITVRVGSKALDKWPIDNEKFIEYAMSIIPKDYLDR